MKALVVFGTTDGHTKVIAERMGDWLRNREYGVEVWDSAQNCPPIGGTDFDLCVIAGSVRVGKHQQSLVRFVRENLAVLNAMPTFFVSASGSGSRSDPRSFANAQSCILTFLTETGLQPTVTKPIGGALLYTKYNFFLKMVMKRISQKEGGPTDTSRDFELTDWKALESALADFLTEHVETKVAQLSAT